MKQIDLKDDACRNVGGFTCAMEYLWQSDRLVIACNVRELNMSMKQFQCHVMEFACIAVTAAFSCASGRLRV